MWIGTIRWRSSWYWIRRWRC